MPPRNHRADPNYQQGQEVTDATLRTLFNDACDRLTGSSAISRVWTVTQAYNMIGVPAGSHSHVRKMVADREKRHTHLLGLLHTIPGLDPSAAHTLIRLSLSKRNDHLARLNVTNGSAVFTLPRSRHLFDRTRVPARLV